MNNYMQQIAEMLGVELGEVFYVKQDGHNIKYILSDDGLHQTVCIDEEEICGVLSLKIFRKILTGELEISKRPWKPIANEGYYRVYKFNGDETIYVENAYWYGIENSNNLFDWKVGNCFRTKEEAEEKGTQIIKQIESEFKKA